MSKARLVGLTPDGQKVELPALSEIQISWDEGLPASLLIDPEHLKERSLSLEVGSLENEEDHIEEYGVLVLKPGACNLVDIEIENHRMDEED
ncbi:hypothetical protein [Marinospirillum perlucidum]|uniref:hypothetical protein n=1 Tax=Marinospirillum perlucidum TaxID=1982602 RepID=UPI000DF1D95D|nr:hypothetical protein [Marinospirillum perlucidum]